MEWLEYSTANCSVQRTLEVIGEKWTMIVLREVFNGVRRFEQMRRHTGISEAVLSARLRTLVEAGVLDTVPYREEGRRTRHEYRLTDKGRDLYPILVALLQWGDKYCADDDGPALLIEHAGCGAPVEAIVRCTEGHGPLRPDEARTRPGPTARPLETTDR
ncbi:helix-turn-helix transcriptional regulator [Rhodococcus sp. Z13]|uniref:Helix-turn-helix transcriptional regulator n=1 Tax=Rhodococcus sacchari TaxID=2962047 RepID=A0ACD4DES2_9NOCA|nr:helix-turn-helix domain-containing protein [Rhodococcus sp. Z13]UYP18484.1 helix-turn-helix transcriptional regulator [Rhodococcus sp. Z13]